MTKREKAAHLRNCLAKNAAAKLEVIFRSKGQQKGLSNFWHVHVNITTNLEGRVKADSGLDCNEYDNIGNYFIGLQRLLRDVNLQSILPPFKKRLPLYKFRLVQDACSDAGQRGHLGASLML